MQKNLAKNGYLRACPKNCVNGHKVVEIPRRENGHGTKKTREGKRYFITSLTDDSFAKAVRSHLGIENSLHWCVWMLFFVKIIAEPGKTTLLKILQLFVVSL